MRFQRDKELDVGLVKSTGQRRMSNNAKYGGTPHTRGPQLSRVRIVLVLVRNSVGVARVFSRTT